MLEVTDSDVWPRVCYRCQSLSMNSLALGMLWRAAAGCETWADFIIKMSQITNQLSVIIAPGCQNICLSTSQTSSLCPPTDSGLH